MTREEIIDLLKNLKYHVHDETVIKLDMAIESLEKEVSQGLVKDSQGFSQESCEDAISREEAFEGLNSINGTSELDKAFEVIENLPPVTPQQKWIPVSERWPEEKGRYLVTVKQGYFTTALWAGIAEYWDNVTAWMPLPQPYKAETRD